MTDSHALKISKRVIGLHNTMMLDDEAELAGGLLRAELWNGKRVYKFSRYDEAEGRTVTHKFTGKTALIARNRLLDFLLAGESDSVAA